MFNGLCSAIIIFFLCTFSIEPQAFNKDGKIAGLDIVGPAMYTCVVWVVNCQMALAISYFTLIQHIFIWGGVALWYLFLLAYGAMSPNLSTTAYQVLVESLAPAPMYWLITLFVVVSALTPYFSFSAIQSRFFPMYHGKIQWMRHEGRADDPKYVNMERQRSIKHTTVGLTARSIARNSSFGGRIYSE